MVCRAALSLHKKTAREYARKNVERESAMRKWFAIILRERERVVIIRKFRTVPAHRLFCFAASRPVRARTVHGHNLAASRFAGRAVRTGSGQVAQVVERSPEKAGVGGSNSSPATTFQSTYSESPDLR